LAETPVDADAKEAFGDEVAMAFIPEMEGGTRGDGDGDRGGAKRGGRGRGAGCDLSSIRLGV
jgi:hypothetical protein